MLASTHGVMLYHPNPQDLWRWTHTGLERLFREAALAGRAVTRRRLGRGTGVLVGNYVHLLAKQVGMACSRGRRRRTQRRRRPRSIARVALLRDPVPARSSRTSTSSRSATNAF